MRVPGMQAILTGRPIILLSFLLNARMATGIKCWGANAFQGAQSNSSSFPECYAKSYDLFASSSTPCWTRCGGVQLFSDQCIASSLTSALCNDPNGKILCPYRKSGVNSLFTSASSISSDYRVCQCSNWRAALPDNACPKCNDLDTVPPLIFSTSSDASQDSSRVVLSDCPTGYDTCFNYCVDRVGSGALQPVLGRSCYYGCAKSKHQEVMELIVSSKLAEVDHGWRTASKSRRQAEDVRQQLQPKTATPPEATPPEAGRGRGILDLYIYNPAEYTCGEKFTEAGQLSSSGTYGCKRLFCTADGCNKSAAARPRPSAAVALLLGVAAILSAAAGPAIRRG
jgi:hypothetical protein